jgi:hypothetical protein
MLESFDRVVVVAGSQRSGTTLTGLILGAHPGVIMIDEPDGLYDWFEAFEAGDPRAGHLLRRALAKANHKYRPGQKRLIRPEDGGRARLAPNVTHLVLKAPNLTYDYDAVARLGRPVSVVYPVREPRSVVASMTKLRHIPMVERQCALIRRHPALAAELSEELEQLESETVPPHVKRALIWRIKSGLFSRFEALGLPVLRFRYEDLVADPEAMCERIAAHVGLSVHEGMLTHETAYRGFAPGMTDRSRPVDQLSVGRFSDRLTEEEQDDVLRVAGDVPRVLGYDASDATPAAEPAAIPDAVLRAPLILVGRGGSGTRLLSDIAAACGVFLGNRQNVSGDSVEWVDLIYEMAIQHGSRRRGRAGTPDGGWERLLLSKARDVLGRGTWQEGSPWGWKLPETMVVVPELFETFHDAKLVHLVRHPVDSSLRRTHMTSRTSNPVGRAVLRAAYAHAGLDPAGIDRDEEYMHNALTWLYQVKRVAEFGRSELTPERYLEVRFEDLCSEPDRIQGVIADFIGASCVPAAALAIDHDRVRGYELSDPRVDEIWDLCGETAALLGYATAG